MTAPPNTRRIIAAAAVLAIVLSSIEPLANAANEPAIQPRGRSAEPVETSTDSTGMIEGFTEPYADIDMAAGEMGTLSRVLVKDGDVVEAGQIIANLDDAVLRASLEVARAGMASTGDMVTAKTQLELRRDDLQKISELFSRNHASRQELDRIRGEVRLAEAKILSVREDSEIRRLEYARIEAQLRQREIRSTIDGIVVDVRKDHGEFVSPSDPVVARIVQLDPLLVVFSVPNNRRTDVRAGQTVQMQIGDQGHMAKGLIEHVSPTADASSGTFRVKVQLPNPERTWYGGEKSVLLLDGSAYGSSPEKIAKAESK